MSILTEQRQLATNLSQVVPPEGLPPIRRVYDVPSISPATTLDCPCMIVFMRTPPKITVGTFGREWRTSQYICQLIWCPVGQGILQDSYMAVIQYCEPILDALWSHIQLNGTEGVQWSIPTQESMPRELPELWGGQAYFGIDFSVTVVTQRDISVILGQ